MQQIITAKLKLRTAPEQHQSLRQTQLAYWDALNYVSRYAFEHGKMSNAELLQQGTYEATDSWAYLPDACRVASGTHSLEGDGLGKRLPRRKS